MQLTKHLGDLRKLRWNEDKILLMTLPESQLFWKSVPCYLSCVWFMKSFFFIFYESTLCWNCSRLLFLSILLSFPHPTHRPSQGPARDLCPSSLFLSQAVSSSSIPREVTPSWWLSIVWPLGSWPGPSSTSSPSGPPGISKSFYSEPSMIRSIVI